MRDLIVSFDYEACTAKHAKAMEERRSRGVGGVSDVAEHDYTEIDEVVEVDVAMPASLGGSRNVMPPIKVPEDGEGGKGGDMGRLSSTRSTDSFDGMSAALSRLGASKVEAAAAAAAAAAVGGGGNSEGAAAAAAGGGGDGGGRADGAGAASPMVSLPGAPLLGVEADDHIEGNVDGSDPNAVTPVTDAYLEVVPSPLRSSIGSNSPFATRRSPSPGISTSITMVDRVVSAAEVGSKVVLQHFGNGIVRYVGPDQTEPSADVVMLGVELETPQGDCDGSQGGHRYFTAQSKKGIIFPLGKVPMTVRN